MTIIKVIKKTNKQITPSESELMYQSKLKEFGSQDIQDFKKGYPNSTFFFVKDDNKIVAFGAFRNLTLKYKNKKYRILGICNIFTIERGKGYGRILITHMINYIKKTRKTGLGFCISNKTMFYEKSGLKTIKNFIPRVVYKNPQGKLEPEDDADALYFEGRDKLITKMLSDKTKSIAYTDLKDW